jgi:hypothetical protein
MQTNHPNQSKHTAKSCNIDLTIPDDSFPHIRSGIEYDSLLRRLEESESHEYDFPGIGPALLHSSNILALLIDR